MHAKVTIASLVFGLAVGFAANIGTSQKITKATEENMVCNHDNHEHIEFSPKPEEAAGGITITPGPGGGSHSHSYSYDYLNDGRHTGTCSCGSTVKEEHTFSAYYPYGHGHNDMLYCSRCGTNVELTRLYENQSSTGSVASGAAKWYLFIPEYTGTFVFETTGSSDTYGELYLGAYPTTRTTYNDDISTSNRNFRITYNLTGGQNVFLRVRGWSWNAASFSLSVRQNHTHNYSQLEQYNSNSHKCVCSCGEYQLQPHSYSYQAFTDAFHKKVCACGRTVTEEHVFNDYLPYGHGHNDLIHCANCGTNVECQRLTESNPINDYIDIDDADWYIFIPQESGTYIFETTGGTDTCGSLYIGDYPTGTPIEDDDNGENNNFRIEQYLNAGQTTFLRVYGYDWYHYGSYSLSVVREQEVLPTARWTIMFYMCGSTLESGGATNSSGNISRVISNILDVPYQPNNFNVIIETGGCTQWNGYNIPNNHLERYYVRNGHFNIDASGAAFNKYESMGSSSAFESFVRWGLTKYPAENVGVILMNHGGAMSGVCFDALHNDDSLTNAEVNQAFRNVLGENPTNKLEFIAYDACLMAVQDVASFNSRYFKYMAASEDEISEIMVSGVSTQWLADLYQYQDTVYALSRMGHDFIRNSCGWEQTYTVFDLSKMEDYRLCFEDFSIALCETISNAQDVQELRDICEYSYFPSCPLTSNIRDYCVADCYSFLNNLKTQWHAAQYITPYVNSLLGFFPDPEQYQVDWNADFRCFELTDSGIIAYHTASLGRNGTVPVMHGLSLHYGYYDEDNECYISSAETDFNVWYNIFVNGFH